MTTGEQHGDTGGPYLTAALICDRLLRESDGVVSAVRIIDRFVVSVQAIGSELPSLPNERHVQFVLLLHFRSGKAQGNQIMTLTIERPDGMHRLFLNQSVYFDGGDERGPVLGIECNFAYDLDGLYWFRIELDGRFISKIPLRLLTSYQQIPLQMTNVPGSLG